MEDEKEFKTDTEVNGNPEPADETGFNISEEFASSLPDAKPEPEKRSMADELFEWLDVLATAIISVVIIFSFIFRVATISGRSMTNTLQDKDKVIITNLAYTPKRGDIGGIRAATRQPRRYFSLMAYLSKPSAPCSDTRA